MRADDPGIIDLAEALARQAGARPQAIAVEVAGGATLSFSQLKARADAVAAALQAKGHRPAGAVLVATRRRERVPELIHGILGAGGVVVSVEASTPAAELARLAAQAHAGFALVDPPLLEALPVREHSALEGIELCRLTEAAPIEPTLTGADRIAAVIFTSGSSGRPKGVLLSHGNLLAAGRRMARVRGHGPDDVHLSYLSFAHFAEQFMSGFLHAIAGYRVVVSRRRDLIATLAEVQPTFVMGVPAEWEMIRGAAQRGTGSPAQVRAWLGLGRVRLALSTGAPLAPATHARLGELGLSIHEMYGMTESTGAATYNPPGAARSGSVGRALEGSRVEVDAEGEIRILGEPFRCRGYLDDPEQTARLFDGAAVRTGDLGRIDEEGYLFITGRRKELIVMSTGKKVFPAAIEARLAAIPGVRYAVLSGEERPYLVALLDAPPEARAAIRPAVEQLNRELPKHERIAGYRFSLNPFGEEELTASLKVRREVILERYGALVEAIYSPGASEAPGTDEVVRLSRS